MTDNLNGVVNKIMYISDENVYQWHNWKRVNFKEHTLHTKYKDPLYKDPKDKDGTTNRNWGMTVKDIM